MQPLLDPTLYIFFFNLKNTFLMAIFIVILNNCISSFCSYESF